MRRRFRCASCLLSQVFTGPSRRVTRSISRAVGAASGISPCRWRRVPWGPDWSSAAARRNPSHWPGSPQAFLHRGMALAMEWATQGLVVPHVSQTIDSTVLAINAGLQSLKAGRGILGKVAVIVDRDLAAGSDGRSPVRAAPAIALW